MTAGTVLVRVLNERRRVLVPLFVAALVNLGAYALVVYPLSFKVGASDRQASAARSRLAAAERDDAAARKSLADAQQADKDLRQFYGQTLPQSVEAARRMSYARLAELADEHGLAITRRTYDRDPSYKGRLERLRIAMALEGEYQDIRAFIDDLERGSEFLVIETLALSEGQGPGEPLAVTLQLATYYSRPEGGA
jgi:Tfp pilus assembly protein PilO